MKPWIILIVLLISSVHAQEVKHFDEYGRITCEDLLARTEAFGQQLQKTRSAQGVVVTYNGGKSLAWQQQFVHRVLIGYYGNGLNVRFYESSDDGESRTEVWVISAEAEVDTNRFRQTLTIPYTPTAKLLWNTESGDPCSGHAFPSFVEMLKTSYMTGRIVLVNYSRSERLFSIGEYRTDLKKHSIVLNRVRFRFKTLRTQDALNPSGYVEYWLDPSGK